MQSLLKPELICRLGGSVIACKCYEKSVTPNGTTSPRPGRGGPHAYWQTYHGQSDQMLRVLLKGHERKIPFRPSRELIYIELSLANRRSNFFQNQSFDILAGD